MFIVDSDFRDNHKKVLMIARYLINSGYPIINGYQSGALQMVY